MDAVVVGRSISGNYSFGIVTSLPDSLVRGRGRVCFGRAIGMTWLESSVGRIRTCPVGIIGVLLHLCSSKEQGDG